MLIGIFRLFINNDKGTLVKIPPFQYHIITNIFLCDIYLIIAYQQDQPEPDLGLLQHPGWSAL